MSMLDHMESISRGPHHHCGGTILRGPDHAYCDYCGAVAYYGEDLACLDWDEAVEALAAMDEGESNLNT